MKLLLILDLVLIIFGNPGDTILLTPKLLARVQVREEKVFYP